MIVQHRIHTVIHHHRVSRGHAVRLHVPFSWIACLSIILILATVFLRLDWSEMLRRAALVQLRYSLQREVTLGRVSLDPRGHIEVANLTIYDGFTSRRRLWAVKKVDVFFDPWKLTSLPFRPASAVRQGIVEAPYAVIARDQRGFWNFHDLQHPSAGKPSGDRFRGEVLIHDGEFIYQDAHLPHLPPLAEHLVHLNVRMSAAGDDMPFRVTAQSVAGHVRAITADGNLCQGKAGLLCSAQVGDIDLSYWRRFLPARIPLTLTAGHADTRVQIGLLPDAESGKPAWQISLLADLHDVKGQYRLTRGPFDFTVAHGQVTLADNVVTLAGINGTLNDIPFLADGTVSHFALPVIAIQAHVQQAETARVLTLLPSAKNFPVSAGGRVTGWVQVIGTVDSLEVTGHLAGPSIYSNYGELRDVQADVAYNGDALHFSNISCRGLGGSITGDAWVSLDDASATQALFHGEVAQLNVHTLVGKLMAKQSVPLTDTASLPQDLYGTISGPVTVTVDPRGNVNVLTRVFGGVQVAGVTQGDIDSNLRVALTDDGPDITIERLQARLPEGLVQVDGTIAPDETLDLRVRASTLNLAMLAGHAGREDVFGAGYVNGQLTGPGATPTFTGALHVNNGAVGGYAFDALYGDVRADLATPREFSLHRVRLIAGQNQMWIPTLTAKADPLTQNWELTGHVQLPRTSITALAASAGMTDVPLEGLVEGSATLNGGPGTSIDGTLHVLRPVYYAGKTRIAFESLTLPFTLRGTVLQLADAQLVYQGVPLVIGGTVNLDAQHPTPTQLDLHVAATLDADDYTTLVKADDPLVGKLTDDYRLRIPCDVQGTFALKAGITAQLTAAKGRTAAETLAGTLAVSAAIDGDDSVVVAGIPYQQVALALAYRQADQLLTVQSFNATRRDHTAAGTQSYRVQLTAPSTLNLATRAVNVQAQLTGATPESGGADLELLRRDLVSVPRNLRSTTIDETSLQTLPGVLAMSRTLRAIPQPFAGQATVGVTLTQTLDQPAIAATLTADKLVLGGDALPDLDGAFSFNTRTNALVCDHLHATGGLSPDAYAEIKGATTLPVFNAQGKEIKQGIMAFDFSADGIDLAAAAHLLGNPDLADCSGQATLVGKISGPTASPAMQASLNISEPSFHHIQFDALDAILTLKDDRLLIGRADMDSGGATTLQFKRTPDATSVKDLEIAGYLPVHWKGSLQPYVPLDKPVYLSINLPRQGLDLVKAYLPQPPPKAVTTPKGEYLLFATPGAEGWKDATVVTLPQPPPDAGTVEGSLTVEGTLNNLRIDNGAFRAQVPEVILPQTDPDLPNRMRDVVADIGFRSEITTEGSKNVLEVKDLSAIYDRVEPVAAKKPKRDYFAWIRSLMGRDAHKTAFAPGAIVAQGTIGIDSTKLFGSNGFSFDALDYDLYAKMVRTPLRYRQLFQGTVTSYLRLGNQAETHLPQLTGVIYAENAHLTYLGQSADSGDSAAAPPHLAFNPQLQVALQMGPGNVFAIAQDNPLFQNTLSASIPFIQTALFPPISQADLAYRPADDQAGRRGMKPPVDKDFPSYRYTAETMRSLVDKNKGSFGWVTGSLAQPDLNIYYAVVPSQSRVELPGGTLTLREGTGDLHMVFFSDETRLTAKAQATGMLDKYSISANIDGVLVDGKQKIDKLPMTFATESAPQGATPLTSDDIRDRLIGLSDFETLLQGTPQTKNNTIVRVGQNIFLRGWFDKVARQVGLETFSVDLDPTMTPETTLITPELGRPQFGTVRLGVTNVFGTPPAWRVWGDYRLPTYKLPGDFNLSDFSISGDFDNLNTEELTLQYKFRF